MIACIAHRHIPAVAYAGHPLPFVMFLLAMRSNSTSSLKGPWRQLHALTEG